MRISLLLAFSQWELPIMRLRHLVTGLALPLFMSLVSPAFAADGSPGPSTFVSELARTALLSVTNDAVSTADRQERLGGLLDKDFDMPRIAHFVLGRYWQKASQAEQQAFTSTYRDFMIRVYSQRFIRYSGETFQVVGERPENATNTIVFTEMNQPSSGAPLKVEWRVANTDGYRIVDISVAGVSMALAQREDFGSFLSQNGGDVSGLIQQLQVKTSALEMR
jgi:phospholipid transport system substrate-binding protein